MPNDLPHLACLMFFKAFAIYFAVVMIRDGLGYSTWWIHLFFWSSMIILAIFAPKTNVITSKPAEIAHEPCTNCHGTGTVMIDDWDSDLHGNQWLTHDEAPCPDCTGSGWKS